MATDFNYGDKTIAASGPFRPTGKDMPSDARTRVDAYADIKTIPNPHVGLKITVKVDETNNNKMTDYIVKSLKANSMGVANSVVDEVVRYVDYLGAGNVNFHTHNNKAILDSITQDNINSWNEKVVTTPSGQVVYKSPAINLFNYTTVQRDTVNGVTGYYSDYINYDNTKKYVTNMAWLGYRYFDSDKNYVSSQQSNAHNSGNYSIIPTVSDSTVKYIRLYFGTSMPDWFDNSHFVEEGTVPLLDYSKTYTTKSRWFGKKLLVLGDSISTERAGIADVTYATQLGIEYGFSSVTNLSVGGKTFLWHIDNLNKYSDDYDLVIVMCGTNDHGYNTAVGDVNSTDNTTISGRVDILINALIEKKIEALIVFLTPIKRVGSIGTADEAYNTTDGYYTKSGVTTKEVGEAIKNKCKQYSIPCIDLYDSIEPKLASIRNKYFNDSIDGTHPSTLGHAKYISPKVVSEIGRLAPFPPVSINTSTEVYGNIVTNPSSLSLNSGDRGSFNVKLDKAPTNEQIISIESTNSNVTLSATELRFTSDNYNNEQTITFEVPSSVTNNFTISLTNPNVVNKSVEVIITAGANISVENVSLNQTTATLHVDDTIQLTPSIIPSNATNKQVTWSSNNGNCTVSNGLVTAVSEGTSIITVTTVDGNKTANCNITVNAKAELTSISAVYTQDDTAIYPNTQLNNLKNNLVVTANYSDGSTATVTDYILSGSLTEGTSAIVVTYQGKTTTFNVVVSANPTIIGGADREGYVRLDYSSLWDFIDHPGVTNNTYKGYEAQRCFNKILDVPLPDGSNDTNMVGVTLPYKPQTEYKTCTEECVFGARVIDASKNNYIGFKVLKTAIGSATVYDYLRDNKIYADVKLLDGYKKYSIVDSDDIAINLTNCPPGYTGFGFFDNTDSNIIALSQTVSVVSKITYPNVIVEKGEFVGGYGAALSSTNCDISVYLAYSTEKTSAAIQVAINNDLLISSDLEGVKNYLINNPINIYWI